MLAGIANAGAENCEKFSISVCDGVLLSRRFIMNRDTRISGMLPESSQHGLPVIQEEESVQSYDGRDV